MKLSRIGATLALLVLTAAAQAQVKISDLPAATTLAGTEAVPAVQSATTVKTTPAAINTYVQSQLTSSTVIGKFSGTCSSTRFLRADGACAQVQLTTDIAGTLGVASGGTSVTTAPDDNLLVGNGTQYVLKTLPTCSGASDALTYDVTANTFGCNTITAGGGTGGNFTVTYSTGCTVAPTQDFTYSQIGKLVTISTKNSNNCTSNSTSFVTAAAALPVLPAFTQVFVGSQPGLNNSASALICYEVRATGALVLDIWSAATGCSGSFTNTGTKGPPASGSTFTYIAQ